MNNPNLYYCITRITEMTVFTEMTFEITGMTQKSTEMTLNVY